MYITIDNVVEAKLLALFGALEERDKDIVLTMVESLVEQQKNDEMKLEGKLLKEGQKVERKSS
jgi:hypothetical protein